jgi:hypothetical protein
MELLRRLFGRLRLRVNETKSAVDLAWNRKSLDFTNRPVRTRMPGGVAGVAGVTQPAVQADDSRCQPSTRGT